jgi:hypothetical protein
VSEYFLVFVIRKGREASVQCAVAIAANDTTPRTPDEAMRKVAAYAGPFVEGDMIYVVPASQVQSYRAEGTPEFVLAQARSAPVLLDVPANKDTDE